MAKLASCTYQFLFDPSEGWSNLSQFENELAHFFLARNFELEIVNSANQGQKILMLRKIDEMPTLNNQPEVVDVKAALKSVYKKANVKQQ